MNKNLIKDLEGFATFLANNFPVMITNLMVQDYCKAWGLMDRWDMERCKAIYLRKKAGKDYDKRNR